MHTLGSLLRRSLHNSSIRCSPKCVPTYAARFFRGETTDRAHDFDEASYG